MTSSSRRHNETTRNKVCNQELPEGAECSESNGVCRWLTIPYAEPMSKRFVKSEPIDEYLGPRESFANNGYGPVCVQWFPGLDLDQSEDCLTLNIWAPNDNDGRVSCDDGELKPVMVWIHGGAFLEGGGATNLAAYGLPGNPNVKLYDGSNLVSDHNVIVVAIQYRLGPFGFLAPGGANGFGDQISALQWIQKHISRFGGDPHKVTLFGESSGSVSICTLLHVPSTKGLFHRAILQSGVCYPSIDFILPKKDGLYIRGNYLDSLDNATSGEFDLKTASVETVLNRTFEIFNSDWVSLFLSGLGAPSVDGDILPNLPILTSPHDGIDVLVGMTTLDQTVPAISGGRKTFLSNFGVASQVGLSYVSDDDSNLFLDACLRCQSQHFLQRVVSKAMGTGYWYTYDCPHGAAPHGSDNLAVFGNVDDTAFESNGVQFLMGQRPSEELIERVQDAWVSFATTGHPGWENATESGMGALIGCDRTTIHPLMDPSGTCNVWTAAADDLGPLGVGSICFRDAYSAQQKDDQKGDDSTVQRGRAPGLLLPFLIAACLLWAFYCSYKKRRTGYSPLR